MNDFVELDRLPVYSDGIGFVALYNHWIANIDQDTREKVIATIATHSYGNEKASNPKNLYKYLQEKKHLSCFEFIHSGADPYYGIDSSLRHTGFKTYDKLNVSSDSVIPKLIENVKDNVALFRIKMPIMIARQFMRHRAFSYLELSRRYVKDSKVEFEFLCQDQPLFREAYNASLKSYRELLKNGMRPELARSVIPVGAYTDFYAMSDVDGLRNFFRLRLDKHAQLEMREVAEAMKEILKVNQPNLYKNIFGDVDKEDVGTYSI